MEETRERAQKNEVQVLLHSQLLVMPVRDLFLERPPGHYPSGPFILWGRSEGSLRRKRWRGISIQLLGPISVAEELQDETQAKRLIGSI
jgi:hypothetical protein